MKQTYLLYLLLLSGLACASDLRDPRWFNKQTRTVFRTMKTTKVVVEATPSSCVVVENNLPPCRHLRSFWPFVTSASRIVPTKAPNFHKSFEEPNWKTSVPSNQPTPPLSVKSSPEQPSGWDWDVFNFGPREVTVTKTVEQIQTTRVFDPSTVVTFSVKGCRPSRLPFDLLECPAKEPVQQPLPERNVIVMAPVQFVHAYDPAPSPSEKLFQEEEPVGSLNITIS